MPFFIDSVVVASGHPSRLEANNVTWDIAVTELATVVEHRPGIYLLMTYKSEAVRPYRKHRRTTDYFGHSIEKITNAVEGILGDSVKAKQLKKLKSLKRFIEQMKMKRTEIMSDLSQKGLSAESRKQKERHLETLDKQIKKANKVLDKMK